MIIRHRSCVCCVIPRRIEHLNELFAQFPQKSSFFCRLYQKNMTLRCVERRNELKTYLFQENVDTFLKEQAMDKTLHYLAGLIISTTFFLIFSTPVPGAAAVGQSGRYPETRKNVLLQNKPGSDNPD